MFVELPLKVSFHRVNSKMFPVKYAIKENEESVPNKKLCSPKTEYKTNNHLLCPTKKFVVQTQTTKQIITCRAQQKNM